MRDFERRRKKREMIPSYYKFKKLIITKFNLFIKRKIENRQTYREKRDKERKEK